MQRNLFFSTTELKNDSQDDIHLNIEKVISQLHSSLGIIVWSLSDFDLYRLDDKQENYCIDDLSEMSGMKREDAEFRVLEKLTACFPTTANDLMKADYCFEIASNKIDSLKQSVLFRMSEPMSIHFEHIKNGIELLKQYHLKLLQSERPLGISK